MTFVSSLLNYKTHLTLCLLPTSTPLILINYIICTLFISFLVLLILLITIFYNTTMNFFHMYVGILFSTDINYFLEVILFLSLFLSRSFPKKSKIRFKIKFLLCTLKDLPTIPFKELSVIIGDNMSC